MVQSIALHYVIDKETKGTLRFRPQDATVIGNVTIYLPKPVVKANGIDPQKGFDLIIKPR